MWLFLAGFIKLAFLEEYDFPLLELSRFGEVEVTSYFMNYIFEANFKIHSSRLFAKGLRITVQES